MDTEPSSSIKVYVKFILVLSISTCFTPVASHDICNFTMKVDRKLDWMGFHRNLSYSIDFENHAIDKMDKPVHFYQDCILAVQQLLPAGIYVDPDELEDLRRANKLSAYPHNGVSTEAAAPHARPFNAYIFAPVEESQVETFLPVHLRYQSPVAGGGWVDNLIENPTAFLRCLDNRLEKCKNMKPKPNTFLCEMEALSQDKKCLWKEVTVNSLSKQAIIWKTPVGNLNHSYLVEVVTMLVLVGGSLALIQVILQHPVTPSLNFNYIR